MVWNGTEFVADLLLPPGTQSVRFERCTALLLVTCVEGETKSTAPATLHLTAPHHAVQATSGVGCAELALSCAELGRAALSCAGLCRASPAYAELSELCRAVGVVGALPPVLALTGFFRLEVRAPAAVIPFCFALEHRRVCNVGRRLAPTWQVRRRRRCFQSKKSKGGCVL